MARMVFPLGGYSLRLSSRYERSADGSIRQHSRVLYNDEEGHHCLWDESLGPQPAPFRCDQHSWAEASEYIMTRAGDWFDEAWRVAALIADSVVQTNPASERPLTIESSVVIDANESVLAGSHFRVFWGSLPGTELGHDGVFSEVLAVPGLAGRIIEPDECLALESSFGRPGQEAVSVGYHPSEILSLARATAALLG